MRRGSCAPPPRRHGARWSGLMSHFATRRRGPTPTFFEYQLGRFAALAAELKAVYPDVCSATPPTARRRCAGRAPTSTWCAPASPSTAWRRATTTPIRRAATGPALSSYVAGIREVEAGESVGYGRRFVAEGPARLAIVPIGYADGVARALTNRGDVLIAGRRCRIPARSAWTSSRCCCPTTDGRPGDEVVFFGAQSGRARGILCEEVGAAARHHQLRGRLRRVGAGGAPLRRARSRRWPAASEARARRACAARPRTGRDGRPPSSRCTASAPRPRRAGAERGGLARRRLPARRLLGLPVTTSTWCSTATPRRFAAAPGRQARRRRVRVLRAYDVRVVVAPCTCDVAPLRGDAGGRRPRAARDLPADLRGRDFTVDAAGPAAGRRPRALVDPCGGIADLRARRLRLCTSHALRRRPAARACGSPAWRCELRPAARGRRRGGGARAPRRVWPPSSGERLSASSPPCSACRRPPPPCAPGRRSAPSTVVLPELAACRGVTQNHYHHLDVFGTPWKRSPTCRGSWCASSAASAPRAAGRRRPAGRGRRSCRSPGRCCCTTSASRRRACRRRGRVIFWRHDEHRRGAGRRHLPPPAPQPPLRAVPGTSRAPAPAPGLPRARAAAHAARPGALPARCRAARLRVDRALAGRPHGHARRADAAGVAWRATSAWRATCGRRRRQAAAPPLLRGDEVMALLGIGRGRDRGSGARGCCSEEVDGRPRDARPRAGAGLPAAWWERSERAGRQGSRCLSCPRSRPCAAAWPPCLPGLRASRRRRERPP